MKCRLWLHDRQLAGKRKTVDLPDRNQDQVWGYRYCDQRPLGGRALEQCWDWFTLAVPQKRWIRGLRCAPAIP